MQFAQLRTERYRKPTNHLSFLRCWEQKQVWYSIPAHSSTKRVAWFKDPPLSWCHLRNQPALLWRVSKCTCYLFLLPCAAAQVPGKPCLNVSSCLLSISTDERVQGRRLVTLFIYLITINAEHYGESQLHGASRRTVLDNKAPCLLPLSISFTFFLLYT